MILHLGMRAEVSALIWLTPHAPRSPSLATSRISLCKVKKSTIVVEVKKRTEVVKVKKRIKIVEVEKRAKLVEVKNRAKVVEVEKELK